VFDADPTHADAWSTALLCLGREAGVEAANKSGIAALFIENQNGNLNEYNSSALDALHTITIK
jgi:thiamine biosynthesis lipoprotein